jgi:hypothetical protein
MITENEYLSLRKALSILHDYLDADGAGKEEYFKEHFKALNKAQDILREFENKEGI